MGFPSSWTIQSGFSAKSRELSAALGYAGEREAFGRKIVKYQEVGYKLADMKMLIDTGSLLTRHAAWAMDEGMPEAFALARGLDAYLPELAEDAARSDSQRNHELWDTYRALESVRDKLAAALPIQPAAGI